MPITKGRGRFGPFIKWNGLFINVPKRIDLDTITVPEAIPLIDAKENKEANRFIHQWPDEKLALKMEDGDLTSNLIRN